jgi:hypothetical protein
MTAKLFRPVPAVFYESTHIASGLLAKVARLCMDRCGYSGTII